MTDLGFGRILEGFAATKQALEPAISYEGETLTWAQFNALTAGRARRLRALGVQPDDLVAVILPNGLDHHVSSFAAWRAGATPCILPPRLPEAELKQIIDLAKPRVIVRDGPEPPGVATELRPGPDDAAGELPPDLAASHWKAVASGGSTGRPKLIVDHAPARFGERLKAITALAGIPSGGVMLNPGPLHHNAPFLFTSLALLSGARVVGMSKFDPEETLRLIAREKVQWVCLVPTMMHRIWRLPQNIRDQYDLSSLQKVLHVGAHCPAWLKHAWIEWLGADRILELYAGTEGAAVLITGQEWLKKKGSVGRVSPEILTIRDETSRICPPGEVGEIWFAADATTRFHYIGAEPRVNDHGHMSLGDLGHVDEDGYLFLSDRRTDLIVRGGANIYPAEVESALTAHPAVEDAVVLGLPCDEYGARVHAVLQMKTDTPVEDLKAFVRSQLAAYKCPETWEVVTSGLRDEAGKVRRAALREQRINGAHP